LRYGKSILKENEAWFWNQGFSIEFV
jgi:hypothetical protein